MAIKWLGGGVDHPMSDAKRARELIDALPPSDPAKALEEIVNWLESINQTAEFKLNQRFEIIDLLDAAARNHARKLSQSYLSMPRQMKFQENRYWNAIFGLWRQLGDGYLRCVKQYEDGLIGMTIIRKSLPVIVARAARALTSQAQVETAALRSGRAARLGGARAVLRDRRGEGVCRRGSRALPRCPGREHRPARVSHGDDVLCVVP